MWSDDQHCIFYECHVVEENKNSHVNFPAEAEVEVTGLISLGVSTRQEEIFHSPILDWWTGLNGQNVAITENIFYLV